MLDPKEEKVYVYKPSKYTVILEGFARKISGEDILPGFELEMKRLH